MAMTDVYSTVLSDEIIPQPPAKSAQKWVNNLLMQLEADGFDGYGKPVRALGSTVATSKNTIAHLSNACRCLFSTYSQ
jgi:hypothetical protein